MATIKSYTDINQSRKLAEILSFKSADMIWILANPDLPIIKAIAYEDSEKSKFYETLPAWSLAALLDILPEINGIPLKIEKVKAEDEYDGYYYHIEYKDIVLIPYFKNSIDACVAMIEHLHKLNLL